LSSKQKNKNIKLSTILLTVENFCVSMKDALLWSVVLISNIIAQIFEK